MDGSPAAGTVKSSGNTSTYTPATGEDGALVATATYTDGGGNTETVSSPTPAVAVRPNPVAADNPDTLVDESGLNTAPKFYEDGVDASAIANRVADDETETYTRYVLENQTRNVRNSEADARDYDDADDNDAAATVNVFDGHFADRQARVADPQTITDDTANLQFDLSGADAKYFSIENAASPANERGLISTKRALDFETRSTYTVKVTATDPAGLTDTVTVTINVLDVPEIEGLEQRIRVDENTKKIADLYNSYPPDNNLGGLKWSLLTTTADAGMEAETSPDHNRNDPRSIDCHVDPKNQGLCDNFRFSRFNTANTTLLFAIGTGEDHKAPNYEKPSDRDTGEEEEDNVYKIVVRVAFANLRSYEANNHPHPEDDERNDRVVWIRVDDVDEAPKFDDDASTRVIAENSDDLLPAIAINRLVAPGTVDVSDPEYDYDGGPQDGKKLTYSLEAGAYDNLFQIVPSTGEILTRARLNYEALTELTEMGPDGGQHRIITVPVVTAADSCMKECVDDPPNTDTIGANIRVNDVNETPIPVELLAIAGDATVSDYAEMQEDTTVGTYTVSGENAATATFSLATGDPDGDGPMTAAQNADVALFDLDVTGREGVLKFKAAPDFEMPADADMDNVYMVTLQVRHDDEDMAYMPVTITVTDVDELGMLTGDASVSQAENVMETLGTYTASGTMADMATWTLMGDDASHFMLEGTTGMSRMLKFKMSPDYEMPRGMAMSDDNMNTYMVTVKAEAGSEMAMQAVEVMVTNEDELDMLTGDASVSQAENVMETLGTYTASGTMADMATWTLMGDDASHFMLEGTTGMSRMLKFKMSPDYEMPRGMAMSGDNMNTYMVTVKAEAGSEMAMQAVEVMVTDVDELDMLTGDASVSQAENVMETLGTYTASGTMADMATWTLMGDDASHFMLEGTTGMSRMLKFKMSPDYEMPRGMAMSDDNTNTYMVTVKAEAGSEMAMQEVTVMVTNEDELDMLTGDASVSQAENVMETLGTYTASGTMADMATWTLMGDDASHFMLEGTTGMSRMLKFKMSPDYEMPRGMAMSGDNMNTYMVTLKAEAGSEMAMQAVEVMVTDVDELDMLTGDASVSQAENVMETLGTYTASGTMADMATWTLMGDDASHFMLEGTTGMSRMLKFKMSPD